MGLGDSIRAWLRGRVSTENGQTDSELPEELQRLLARLGEPDCSREEREAAIKALCERHDISRLRILVEQPHRLFRPGYNWAVRLIAAEFGNEAIDPLIDLLTPKPVVPVLSATHILSHIGGARVLKALITINPSVWPSEDDKLFLAWRKADVLKQMGAEATEPLIECLSHRDPLIRCSAASELADYGDERAVEPLRALKNDKRHRGGYDVSFSLTRLEERLAAARAKEPADAVTADETPLFEVQVPDQEVFYCSDNDCPCGSPGAEIRRGEGYLYISEDVVEARRDALTLDQLEAKLQRLQQATGAAIFFDQGTIWPILMCEQAARRRGLDLTVAATDARQLFETGRVPLRVTPKV